MNAPNILLVKDLIKPTTEVLFVIEKSQQQIKIATSEIVEKSIFSYVVSLFEILQTEILGIILDAFPEKMKKSDFQVSKEELSNGFLQIKKDSIEKYIQSLSYSNLNEYLKIFFDILSIPPITRDITNQMIEIKETRNLLLHNNLKMNNTYQRKAGVLQRRADYNGNLPLEKEYILTSINTIKTIIEHIQHELGAKYIKYDKRYVLKNLWNYLFHSPVLKFDDFWESDSENLIFKKSVRQFKALIRHSFSSSETLLLFYWINHFNSSLCDKCFEPRYVNTFSLDVNTRNKYLYLNNVIINYPELFKT